MKLMNCAVNFESLRNVYVLVIAFNVSSQLAANLKRDMTVVVILVIHLVGESDTVHGSFSKI